jgi:ankyrin repeat protein
MDILAANMRLTNDAGYMRGGLVDIWAANMRLAIRTNDAASMRRYLRGGVVDVNAFIHDRGHTTLHYACLRGNAEMVELLLTHGADARMTTQSPYSAETALHFAISSSPVVRLLLRYGADANALNCNRETPLFYCANTASTSEAIEVAKLLMENGADCQIEDAFGKTALQRLISVCAFRRIRSQTLPPVVSLPIAAQMTRLLLEHGADANGKISRNKMSFLQCCADKDLSELVPVLMEHGASTTSRDSNGKLSLDLACERGHVSCIYLLLKSMYGCGLIHFKKQGSIKKTKKRQRDDDDMSSN